jgi:dTDP-4-amino-4,6-dideoxygalactose transaminase
MKTTNDKDENKYKHDTFGLNYRLDEIQASVLNINLKYLVSWNLRRKQIAEFYLKNLNLESIKPLNSSIILSCSKAVNL